MLGNATGRFGVPELPGGFVSRDRLSADLDRAARERLIVLSGPGGSGKSMLIADWVRRLDGEVVVWISLDATVRRSGALWHRVARALVRARVLPPDTPVLEGEEESEWLPGELVTELLAIEEPVLVVLDDFHHADPEIADELAWVLERTPQVRAVVTTRRDSDFSAPRIRARLSSTRLAESALAFTLRESTQVVGLALDKADDAFCEAVFAAAHGHPLLTRLAISLAEHYDAAPDPDDIRRRVQELAAGDLLPVFADDDERTAAWRLSLAPDVDVDLAARLLGRDDAETVLEGFEHSGLGTFRVESGSRRFRFHPLVHAALEHARPAFDSGVEPALRSAIAASMERAGDPFGAVGQLLAAGSYEAVWPTVVRHFSELWNHHAMDVDALLRQVPRAVFERHPTLAVSLAAMQVARETVPSSFTLSLTDQAITPLTARLDSAQGAERLILLTALFGAHRAARRFDDAARIAVELRDELRRNPPASPEMVDVLLVQLIQAALLVGDPHEAVELAHEVTLGANRWRTVHTLSLMSVAYAAIGDMAHAVETSTRLDEVMPDMWRGRVIAIGGEVAEALSHLDRFDAAAAQAILARERVTVDFSDLWPYSARTRAFAHLIGGAPAEGADAVIDLLQRTRRRPASPALRGTVLAAIADVLLAGGQPARARRTLEAADPEVRDVALARARLKLAEVDVADALGLVDRVLLDDRATVRQRAEALLLAAVIHARRGHIEPGREAARRALALIGRYGPRFVLAKVPHAELLDLLAEDPAAVELVSSAPDPFGAALNVAGLSRREIEVLAALVAEDKLAAVAARLFVSPNTIKSQVRSIYRKLGVSSRDAAISVAHTRGLLDS